MNLMQKFEQEFGEKPTLMAKAPGRVNLIGEHTDYNDGFVMPIAIQYAVTILARPREDQDVLLYSADFDEQAFFQISDHIPHDDTSTWSNYQRGVVSEFWKRGMKLKGADLLVQGNVPIGSGLSSSAAVEMGTAAAFKEMNGLDISMVDMARLAQAAENHFVGMNCGIMDQFISGMGQAGKALFLDCRSLNFDLVPFPSDDYTVVIMNTKVKRELTGTEYNERRACCEEGVRLLQAEMPDIKALRDVSVAQFEAHKYLLPELTQNRCQSVIYENDRVIEFVKALKAKHSERMGELLLASHRDLRDLYEVSCPELDLMVELAMGVDGVIGARMTGAGFGGCAIAVVKKGKEKAVEDKILSEYPGKTGIQPEIYISNPSDGASVKTL